MPAPPAVRVAPVDATLRPAVLRLRVRPDQGDFVSPVAHTLPDAERCPGSTPMAILLGDVAVGYCRIEDDARSIADCDVAESALGLRSFFIDRDWQGRGLGARAIVALRADLRARRPRARRLVLAVNCRNRTALALYLRAGFVDGGGLYHGGRAGPQHLLWRPLP